MNLNIKRKHQNQHKIYLWHKANVENLEKEVAEKISQTVFDPVDIDKNWTNFRNILTEAADKFVPQKLSSLRHNLPWYNLQVKKLGKKKQRLYNKAKRSKIASDFTAFKACRAEYRKLLKNARQDYYIDFLEPKIDKHSRYLFNHIKKLKKDNQEAGKTRS